LNTTTPTLPFGRYAGLRLAEVPTAYLSWLIREAKLSSGLRLTVAGELESRGVAVPPPPAPRQVTPCRDCPGPPPISYGWAQDSLGRARIRAECACCRRLLTHPPCVPPYTTFADAAASAAPVLDALIRLEALGVELVSDGKTVSFQGEDWRKVPPELRAIVRQCSHQLAGLLGSRR
jgi:uncharacterized protein (DUF3820 family)